MYRRTFLKTTAAAGALAALPRTVLSHRKPLPGIEAVEDDWLQDAVDAALSRGATYAEILYRSERKEHIQFRKDAVHGMRDSSERGLTLRVYRDGGWGSASVPDFDPGSPADLAATALATAAARRVTARIEFDPGKREESGSLHWETPLTRNPFDVPVDEKIEFLRSLTARPLAIPQLPYAVANSFAEQVDSRFLSSLGSSITQRRVSTYVNFAVTAFHQRLRRIDNRSSGVEAAAAGWEITGEGYVSELETAMQEVLRKQTAEPVKEGRYDVIVHPTLLWDILFDTLLPHLDPRRVLGIDGSRPGDRWLAPGDIGQKHIASSLLHLRGDSTLSRGLATAGWDDSGRPAGTAPLVEAGVVRALPADDMLPVVPGAGRFPFSLTSAWGLPAEVAMPNIVMQEGDAGDLADLIAGVDNGLLLKGRSSIVTNASRTLFRVRPQMAWLIKGGKVTDVVRDVEVETSVEQFWNALVAVGRGKDTITAGDLFPDRASSLWRSPFSVCVPPARFDAVPVYSAAEAR